jgi:hypothetical protein
MDTKHFAEEIVGGLDDVCYPEGRNPHERKVTPQFGNEPICNTRTEIGPLEQSEFKRMEHPAYRLDLAACDFFLFGYMKEQLKGRSFAEEEELLSVLSEPMSDIPRAMMLQVFAD